MLPQLVFALLAAGGGLAAARLLKALTPGERAALLELGRASFALARAREHGATTVVGQGPYRAGPLRADNRRTVPPGERGLHGEPPLEEADARFADAHRAFEGRLRLALDSEQLRKNLLYYQRTWRNQRDTAHADLGPGGVDGTIRTGAAVDEGFLPLRREMAAIKDDVIDRLDEYVEQFIRAAVANGVHVYRAADARAANRYVIDLAERHGLRRAIKSKSMVSEEIHLNHALEDAGIEVVETDFGEWIAQLDEDRPGHMISPIAHKNRYEVGAIISKGTGVTTTGENIGELAAIARQQIRRAFLNADFGISGANALVASNGTVMLVTNEGNGRLVTSLPRVHVAICGAEKIVPDMAAAMKQIRLLGRSGTGQIQTVYTTFKSGPDRPDGEMHVILLDNGRAKLRDDPKFASALRCIRCGACANVCPPYGVVAGHAFGYIYAGAIGLVTTAFHHGLENVAGAQSLCLQCNACATVCPVEIPLPRQILDVRRRVVDVIDPSPLTRALLALWREPRLFDRLTRLAGQVAERFAIDDPIHGRLVTGAPIPAEHAWRTPPSPAPRPARETIRPRLVEDGPFAESAARGLKVAYFVQCLTDRLYPEMAQAVVDTISACGATVIVPQDQHCCGLIADDAGDRPGALALAKATIVGLENLSVDWIVTGGASCAIAMLHDYRHLFADDAGWRERAQRLSGRVVDLVSFLVRVARIPGGRLAHLPAERVTLHDFCGSYNVLFLRQEPRTILRDVLGLDLVEMSEPGTCCGFGGGFSLEQPAVARHVVGRKIAAIEATSVSTVVTDNPGCIGHLRGTLHHQGTTIRVRHIAEVFVDRLAEFRAGR